MECESQGHVPIWWGEAWVAAYIDSGNTFNNIFSPETMKALGFTLHELEAVPQLSLGTAAKGQSMKILHQTHRVDLSFSNHPDKFGIHLLVLQRLVQGLVNIFGTFLARARIDQLHSQRAL